MGRLVIFTLLPLLVMIGVACGGPTPTPTTLPTAAASVTLAPTAASAPTTAAIPTPAHPPTNTPTPTASPTPTATPTPPPIATPTPKPTPIPRPVASFSLDVSSENAPVTVQFTDKSEGSVTSVEWDFGDGSSSTARSPRHRYTVAGASSLSPADGRCAA